MINNRAIGEATRLSADHFEFPLPRDGYAYAHHASLGVFQDKLYAMWSNGKLEEDYCGQRVLMSLRDEGGNWCEPFVLIDGERIGSPNSVFTAAGMYAHEDVLTAYVGCYEYDPEEMEKRAMHDSPFMWHHLNTRCGYLTSMDGVHWSDVTWMPLYMVPNHPPRPTKSGRLIISGNISFPYTDDPYGHTDYSVSGVYGDYFGDDPVIDDSETIHFVTKARGWEVPLLCEGAFYQTDDDVLHALFRTNTWYLYTSESRDDGETWSEPQPTQMSDGCSKFDVGRLPDGRFYYVGNTVSRQGRYPLMLCLSNDGENFDKHFIVSDKRYEMQYPAWAKGGYFGYPNALVWQDRLWVICSKCKEVVEVASVRLADLSELI